MVTEDGHGRGGKCYQYLYGGQQNIPMNVATRQQYSVQQQIEDRMEAEPAMHEKQEHSQLDAVTVHCCYLTC